MNVTRHAKVRQDQRGISTEAVEAAVSYGRIIRGRNAEVYFLGVREVRQAHARGIDLRRAKNVQVVLSHDGAVITCYRTARPSRDWCRRRRSQRGGQW
jgi:hypothetical protein